MPVVRWPDQGFASLERTGSEMRACRRPPKLMRGLSDDQAHFTGANNAQFGVPCLSADTLQSWMGHRTQEQLSAQNGQFSLSRFSGTDEPVKRQPEMAGTTVYSDAGVTNFYIGCMEPCKSDKPPRPRTDVGSTRASQRMRLLASAVEYVRRNKMECVASFFSAMGSMLLSFNGEHAKYAWIIFFVSNAMFVGMAIRKRLFGFLVLQTYFTITAVIGVVNYF